MHVLLIPSLSPSPGIPLNSEDDEMNADRFLAARDHIDRKKTDNRQQVF
jgi:hypothetical protein